MFCNLIETMKVGNYSEPTVQLQQKIPSSFFLTTLNHVQEPHLLNITLHRTNISHLGKRKKNIFKSALGKDMLLSRRVEPSYMSSIHSFLFRSHLFDGHLKNTAGAPLPSLLGVKSTSKVASWGEEAWIHPWISSEWIWGEDIPLLEI